VSSLVGLILWLALALSLLGSAIAIARRLPFLLPAAAVIGLPFFVYLGLNPRYGWLVFAVPLCQGIAAMAVARGARALATALCAPALLVAIDVVVSIR
jgi:hypothetical protein